MTDLPLTSPAVEHLQSKLKSLPERFGGLPCQRCVRHLSKDPEFDIVEVCVAWKPGRQVCTRCHGPKSQAHCVPIPTELWDDARELLAVVSEYQGNLGGVTGQVVTDLVDSFGARFTPKKETAADARLDSQNQRSESRAVRMAAGPGPDAVSRQEFDELREQVDSLVRHVRSLARQVARFVPSSPLRAEKEESSVQALGGSEGSVGSGGSTARSSESSGDDEDPSKPVEEGEEEEEGTEPAVEERESSDSEEEEEDASAPSGKEADSSFSEEEKSRSSSSGSETDSSDSSSLGEEDSSGSEGREVVQEPHGSARQSAAAEEVVRGPQGPARSAAASEVVVRGPRPDRGAAATRPEDETSSSGISSVSQADSPLALALARGTKRSSAFGEWVSKRPRI